MLRCVLDLSWRRLDHKVQVWLLAVGEPGIDLRCEHTQELELRAAREGRQGSAQT